MRRLTVLFVLSTLVVLLVASLAAKDDAPQWKALQLKHFTVKSGVDFAPEDLGFLYDGVLDRLHKSKLADQVLDDAATVPQKIGADSVVIEGTVTYFEQGSALFHQARAHIEFKLYRASDHRLITTVMWMGDGLGARAIHGKAWRYIGNMPAHDITKAAEKLQPLASYAAAPPAEAQAPAAAGAPQATAGGEVLTNDSIIEMVTTKLPEDVIIAKIQAFPNKFDLSNSALVDLNQKGVSPGIMKAMLAAPKTGPAPAAAANAPSASIAQTLPPLPHHEGPYSVMEVKHLTVATGVQFPPKGGDAQAYLDAFYETFLKELEKEKFAVQAVAEGSAVPDAANTDAVIIEGKITDFQFTEPKPFHPPVAPVMTMQFNFYRRSDHYALGTMTLIINKMAAWPFMKSNTFGKTVPYFVVKEMKKH